MLTYFWNKRRDMLIEAELLTLEAEKIRAESNKLFVESGKIYELSKELKGVECDNLKSESDRVWDAANKLNIDSGQLYARAGTLTIEGAFLFNNAVNFYLGNDAMVRWDGDDALVGGVRFKWEK